MSDADFIRLALRLAAKAQGATHPNPMVGAVVVRAGRVVGRGFHHRAGQPHAEVMALAQAGARAKGATLYVTLEPCAHFGRTPPCTEAILKSGIRRVVVAMKDPNPKTKGRGLRRLQVEGIRTAVGVLENEAQALNRVFVTWMTKGRPFVTVKVAQSLDGKIATPGGESRWISGAQARAWVHRLRLQVDAILVGVETVLKDDPRLTVRPSLQNPPLKVVLDSHLKTPPSARLFSSKTPVLIAATKGASHQRENHLRQKGAQVVRFSPRQDRVPFKALLRDLAERGISHLLIEGGGQVIASAFEAQAVDRFYCIVAPKIIGGKEAPTPVEGAGIASLRRALPIRNVTVSRLGPDLLVRGDVYWNR